MIELFNIVKIVISNLLNIFSLICNILLTNTLFQLTIGIVILVIIIGLIFSLLRSVNPKKSYKKNQINFNKKPYWQQKKEIYEHLDFDDFYDDDI